MQIMLTSTMTGKKQQIVPLKEGHIMLYVCGVTPYDYSHVGHGRCYVTFDLLFRLLQAVGLRVTYCRNFTDIDDKLLVKAEKELGDASRYPEIASRFIAAFTQDVTRLGCVKPTYEPRVTEHIPQIIAFIEALVAQGNAYVVEGDVYFSIKSYPSYGQLSGRKVEELKAGARVQVAQEKRDPLDFALWKSEPEGTFWKSPFGWGRPGWHIECSALAKEYLGQTIDIHGGGMDLIFPHHENERAQSEARFKTLFVRTWVHNAFVRINAEKMSKSLGNFFTLRDIFAQFDPLVVRYYFLMTHYRNPLDFSHDDIAVAQKSYQRLCRLLQGVSPLETSHVQDIIAQTPAEYRPIIESVVGFLCDDLNTSGMFGVIFEHFNTIAQVPELARAIKTVLQQIVGLALVPLPEKEVAITPEMQQLLDEREAARKAKDFKRADEIRAQLKELGYEVQDKRSL